MLRIADESYVLIESKLIAEKFIFLKNLFLKCKLVDVHLSKQFIQSILYFYKFIKEFTIEKGMEKKDSKIMSYMEEKVVLIKSMNLHSMNLCLSTDINNLDFSNMIVLPEFELSNKSYRLKSLTKDMTNHYLTNVLAKFPKLSFIFQNLRNPLATIKSLFEAR